MSGAAGDDLRTDLVVGAHIARAEVVDAVRRKVRTRREQAFTVLIALLVSPFLLAFIRQAYALGVLSQQGVDFPVVAVARNLFLPIALLMVVFGGLGAAQSLTRDAVRPLLLTTASTRAIVVGKVLYLGVTWLLPLGFGIVAATAFAAGARAPWFLVALLLAAVPVFALTVCGGLTLGYALWLGVERLGLPQPVRRLLTASLSVVAFVAAFSLGIFAGRGTAGDSLGDVLPTGDPLTPLGWYADLLFVGSPMAEPVGVRSLIAAVLVLGLLPVAFVALVTLAPRYWYATSTTRDGSDTTEETDETEAGPTQAGRTPGQTIGRLPSPAAGGMATITGRLSPLLVRWRTLRVAVGYGRGAVRRPDQFVYLFYYLFPVVGLVPLAVESPATVPAGLGVALVVLGVWFAGAVFCLNPLGVEGAMLSQVVLAEVRAETFVHARLLAGFVTGGIISFVGIILLSGTITAVTLPLAVLGTVLTIAVVVTSAAFALGIGAVLPRFETVEVFDSVETVAPSVLAALTHGFVTLLALFGAATVTVLVAIPDSPMTVGERVLALVSLCLVLAVLADGSRRYAIARLRDYGRPAARLGRPLSVYVTLALVVLGFLLGQAVALTAVIVFGFDLPLVVWLPTLFVVEYAGFALVALGFLWLTHRGWAYLDLGWPTPRELGVVFVGTIASLSLWAGAVVALTGLGVPAADHALFDAEAVKPRVLLLLVPLVLFVNAPVEELLFRNVIQKYLDERFSTGAAIALASALFALAHVPAYAMAGMAALASTLGVLFLISLFWGWLYARTRSLFVVAAVHGLYNAALVFGLYVWLVMT